MATQIPPEKPPAPPGGPANGGEHASWEVELLKVVVARGGRQVSAQWAIHPQIKKDLKPEEWKEVSDLMAKVTGLVGARFAEILAEAEPDRPGNA